MIREAGAAIREGGKELELALVEVIRDESKRAVAFEFYRLANHYDLEEALPMLKKVDEIRWKELQDRIHHPKYVRPHQDLGP